MIKFSYADTDSINITAICYKCNANISYSGNNFDIGRCRVPYSDNDIIVLEFKCPVCSELINISIS